MSSTDLPFSTEDIQAITENSIKQAHHRLHNLPRKLQKFLYSFGKPSRAWPSSVLHALLPLISYAGGCDTTISYQGRYVTIEERINLIVVNVMDSGMGKSVMTKQLEKEIEILRQRILPVMRRQYFQYQQDCSRSTSSGGSKNLGTPIEEHLNILSQAGSEPELVSQIQDLDIVEEENLQQYLTIREKKTAFIPTKISFERITLPMLIQYVGTNSEGRFSAIQIVDEAVSIYKGLFNPSMANKSQGDSYALSTDFLIKLFDGSRLSNDTKDAFKSGMISDLPRHGMTAFMNVQSGPLYNSIALSKDEEGVFNRLLFYPGERKYFNAYPHEMDGTSALNETERSHLERMYGKLSDEDFNPLQDKSEAYQLEANILLEDDVEFSLTDLLFKIWITHPLNEDGWKYHMSGNNLLNILDQIIDIHHDVGEAAERIAIIIMLAENKLQNSKNLAAHQRRWFGKIAAKILRLVWPLHVLIHVFKHCKTKDQLTACKIPLQIADVLVAEVASDLLTNSYTFYDEIFRMMDHLKERRTLPRYLELAVKVLKHKDSSFNKRQLTNWKEASVRHNVTEIELAFDWLCFNKLAIHGVKKDTITVPDLSGALSDEQLSALNQLHLNQAQINKNCSFQR